MEDAGSYSNPDNLSRKIVDIAAGESHTLLLTGDGNMYTWGKGMFGRLGLGSQKDELYPVKLNFENPNGTGDSVKIVGIAAGAYHSLALAGSGETFSLDGNSSQSGLIIDLIIGEDSYDSLVPCLLSTFLELQPPDSSTGLSESEAKPSLKMCSVKAGGMMSLAIDNRGTLWMWGNIPQESKEGGLSFVSSFTPTPVWDFHGRAVVKVACGNEHVVALVSATESHKDEDLMCYSWGCNGHGQLGLGDRQSRLHPEVVKIFDEETPWTSYDVACGAFHTALLAHKKSGDTLESMCWTFGLSENGQLGHGTTQSALFPMAVKELPQNAYLISVDCGLFHTCVVSSTGDVWSWGMEKGLGLCPDANRSETGSGGDALSPLLISCKSDQPIFPGPVKVVCGAAHTVVVAQKGHEVWSWGRGRSGVLGNGKEMDSYTPTIVLWPPATEDLKEEELKSNDEQDKDAEKKTKVITETDEKLSSALNELKLLQSKLSIMEKYASILHGSIFGKPFDEQDIPVSMQNSGSMDIAKEWDNMLEAADNRKLVRMEMFYRDMLAGVKDKLMKRKIKEIIKECLPSSEVNNN
ncbi:hypothetical protein TSUD_307970 [Trifolium subterraneum]|nr:hypothetical protein TSUD_307970 [Trifolium subterraneum]